MMAVLTRATFLSMALMALMSITTSAVAESQSIYGFETRAEEQRFQNLIAVLRCPKCQNQNIADSNAPISKDMRAAVYRMMTDGASDEEITNALVDRFGEFVRYKPQMDARTFMLWATPALVVLIGILIVLVTMLRSRSKSSDHAGLTDDERARASQLLSDRDNNDRSS